MFGQPKGRQVLTPAFVYVIIKNKWFEFLFFADTVRELKKCFNLTSSLGVYCADLDLGSFPSLLCRTSGGRGSGSGSGPSTRVTGSRLGATSPSCWQVGRRFYQDWNRAAEEPSQTLSIQNVPPPPTPFDCIAHVATLSN